MSERELSRREYHDLRADMAEKARGGRGPAPFQRCRTCGTCEIAGGYCSTCRNGRYVLDLHIHDAKTADEPVCPLARRTVAPAAVLIGSYVHVPGASARPLAAAR